ncbi:MAG: hypothetical protein AAGE52_40565, partial [Myxococcota bacterium]
MSRALHRIQAQLARLYDLDVIDLEPFLCDEEAARAVVGDGIARGEVLLVAEDKDGISVGLYVAPEAIAELETDDPAFEAFSLAAEGVSHFVYLLFRATNDESVSQLELELQAEVDKYATALLEGWGMRAIQERSRSLRRKLFDEVEFIDESGTVEGERYRIASRAAARYAAHLERRYVVVEDLAG